MLVSIIIPVYNDAEALAHTLRVLSVTDAEVIVAATPDDDSLGDLRRARPDVIWVDAPRGRARQMNAGAAVARGEWLIFLHADTCLPPAWSGVIKRAANDARVRMGCFRFALDSTTVAARVIECGVRVRVRLSALPYGDQALFLRRSMFVAIGGYSDFAILEDVDLVRRIGRGAGRGWLFRAKERALTSARRWEQDGWIGRTVRHIAIILLYFGGVSPDRLIRIDPGRARPSRAEAAE